MNTANVAISRLLLATLLCMTLVSVASAQSRGTRPSSEQEDDVIRIKTELVQTDVAVVDKQGRFVDGLQPEQFELRINGKPKSISFFERVRAGSPEEEKQLTARRSRYTTSQVTGAASVNPQTRARMIFFFVDDVHLAAENLARARQALIRFVDDEMGQGDQVAVFSTSGQIGFLQQLTNNKSVLREAISRLVYKRNPEVNADSATISEYDANQVEAGNRELFRYLVGAIAKLGGTNPVGAVINRSRQVSATARFDTVTTLTMLDSLMRSSASLPGRKIVFFISDGFVTDVRRSGVLDSLRKITKTAAQVGAVIYTMDARGTFADTSIDASKNPYPDFTGSVSRSIFTEARATQEPLRILADDTGGQAILNSNSFEDGFRRALNDSSDYYLLAWRPESEEYLGEKARIKVSIKDRPDLKVRLRRGFIESPAVLSTKKEDVGKLHAATSPESELLATLSSTYAVRTLPVALSVGYMSTPDKGMVLTASMQIEAAALKESAFVETQKAEIDVLGVALDDRGSISRFKQTLSIPAASLMEKGEPFIIWNQQLPISPGLYQVRIAIRDRQSGRTGSAMQWLEIPRITPETLAMSSIFIGEQKTEVSTASLKIPVSVTRRLARGSRLRYQTYFYNVPRKENAPEIVIRVQILRDGQPVMLIPQTKLAINGGRNLTAHSYSGEISLEQLAAGHYVLQISALDQETKKSVSQQTDFIVE